MPPEGLYHLHNGLNIALRPKASCFVICFWIKTLLVFATIQKKKNKVKTTQHKATRSQIATHKS